jgi:rhamnogalacturonyl hydrolase YesR
LAELLQRVANRTRKFDFSVWFWGDAIAVDGILEAAEICDAPELQTFCLRFFERWLKSPPGWTDYLTPGPALLRLYERTGREELMAGAIRLANWYRETVPRGPGGVHYYRPDIPQFRTMVIIDSLYHVVPFFALLGRITKDAAYFDEAYAVWRSHVDYLKSDRGPLLAHNYDVGTGRHRGYGWGRGNGWALFALLELLEMMPTAHPARPEALREFQKLSTDIRSLQDDIVIGAVEGRGVPTRNPQLGDLDIGDFHARSAFVKGQETDDRVRSAMKRRAAPWPQTLTSVGIDL